MIQMGWFIFEEGHTWYHRILKRGFGHVSFLGRDKYNWFRFNPLDHALDFQILPAIIENRVELLAKERFTKVVYVEYRTKKIGKKWPRWNPFLNCVSLLKYLTGLTIFSMTPYGFYKKLIRLSAHKNYPAHIVTIREVN